MEKIRINQMANNQIEVRTATEARFYSYNTCIAVIEFGEDIVLSDNPNHFTKTTVKWLNKWLEIWIDATYADIKKTAKRANLN